jgi:branched-chain amino acid transport system permease protein
MSLDLVRAARTFLLPVRGVTLQASILVLLAVALLLPYFASPFSVYIILLSLAYVPVVLGFNLLFGYTGLLSFGHGLFLAIGMYTGAFLMATYSITCMEVILLVAIAISAIVGLGVGLLCVRYTRIFFAMLTLAFGMLFYTFLLKFYYLTGGDQGMGIYLRPTLLGISLTKPSIMDFLTKNYYYYVLAIVVLTTLIMYRITSSHFGLCLKSIKENAVKAEELGIDVKRYRLYAFIISAIYTAIGGALLAQVTRHVVPAASYWTTSGEIVFMTLLGGFEHFLGPVIGAFVYILLRDQIMSVTIYWRIIMGAMLLLIILFVPGGLAEGFRALSKRMRGLVRMP